MPGPLPTQCLARLEALDVPVDFIHGNGEREVLAAVREDESPALPEAVREALRWTASELSTEQQKRLSRWPPTVRHSVEGLGDVLFCHATPRNDWEIFTPETPDAALEEVFVDTDALTVICGHTHMQFERVVGDVRIVNPGSVGMPFDEPGAYWAVFGPAIDLRRTAYDLDGAADLIRSTAYPGASQFAEGHVLNPPSRASMLEALAGSALS